MKKIFLIAGALTSILFATSKLEARHHCCHHKFGFNVNIQPAPRPVIAYQPAPVVYAAPAQVVYPGTTVIYQQPTAVYYPVQVVRYPRQPRASFSFGWFY